MLTWIHDHFFELTFTYIKLLSNSSSLNKGNYDPDGVCISDLTVISIDFYDFIFRVLFSSSEPSSFHIIFSARRCLPFGDQMKMSSIEKKNFLSSGRLYESCPTPPEEADRCP